MDTSNYQFSVEKITPEMAASYLGYNTANRNMRNRLVDQYEKDMLAGNWQLTGDPIRFSAKGRLLDGQHRLAAIVQSGVSVDMFVIRGLDEEAQLVMDTGSRRTFSDYLRLTGETNCTSLAAAVRAVTSYKEHGNLVARHISTPRLMKTLNAHPELRDGTRAIININNSINTGLSAGGLCWWLFNDIDREDSARFFDKLTSGADLKDGDPILALRRVLLADVRGRRNFGLTPNFKAALIIKAWNKWRTGEVTDLLRWTPGGSKAEAFPTPV